MSTPVKAYMPISELVIGANGLVTQPWFRFFQTMATSTDSVILANIPLLRTQVNSMLSDVATLQSQVEAIQATDTRQDDELQIALTPLPMPQPAQQNDDLSLPMVVQYPTPESELNTLETAKIAQLSRRIDDLENWSL